MAWHPHSEAAVQRWIELERPALHLTLGDPVLLGDLIGKLKSDLAIENLEFISALTEALGGPENRQLEAVPGGLGLLHRVLPVPLERPPPPRQRDAQGKPAQVRWADWRAVALFRQYITAHGAETANLPSRILLEARTAFARPVEPLHGELIAASGLTLQSLAEGLPHILANLGEAYFRYRAGLDHIVDLREGELLTRFADGRTVLDEERRHQGAKLRTRTSGQIKAWTEMADGLPLLQLSLATDSPPRTVREERLAPLVTASSTTSEGMWVREGTTLYLYFARGTFRDALVEGLEAVVATHGASSLRVRKVSSPRELFALEEQVRPKKLAKVKELPGWARKAVSTSRHAADALGRGLSSTVAHQHTRAQPKLAPLTALKVRAYDSVDEALAGARTAMTRKIAHTRPSFVQPLNQRLRDAQVRRKLDAIRGAQGNTRHMVYALHDLTVRRDELRVFEIWLYGGSAMPGDAATPREQPGRWVRLMTTRQCLQLR